MPLPSSVHKKVTKSAGTLIYCTHQRVARMNDKGRCKQQTQKIKIAEKVHLPFSFSLATLWCVQYINVPAQFVTILHNDDCSCIAIKMSGSHFWTSGA